MLLERLVLYYAVTGGASALAGWVLSESLQGRDGRWFSVALTCGLVGGAVGIGLNLVAGVGDASWGRKARRVLPGLVAGALAGAIGGSLGNLVFSTLRWNRAIGWAVMGAGLGAVEGLYERSPVRLRAGLIGGTIGGTIGGLLFSPVASMVSPPPGPWGRAAGFVVLGVCIGAVVGLARAVLAEAWLTVLDGDRPGRRVILATPTALLGRARHAALPFRGGGETGVDAEHARIVRLGDGRFSLEDNHSRHGTRVNSARLLDRVVLRDGDLIRIGASSIRFRDRLRWQKPATAPAAPPERPATAPDPARVTAAPPGPVTTAAPKPAGPVRRGMSLCPKCQRPVLGTRPYCVVCRISF